jgi:hypothetical protein
MASLVFKNSEKAREIDKNPNSGSKECGGDKDWMD